MRVSSQSILFFAVRDSCERIAYVSDGKWNLLF